MLKELSGDTHLYLSSILSCPGLPTPRLWGLSPGLYPSGHLLCPVGHVLCMCVSVVYNHSLFPGVCLLPMAPETKLCPCSKQVPAFSYKLPGTTIGSFPLPLRGLLPALQASQWLHPLPHLRSLHPALCFPDRNLRKGAIWC